MTKWLTFPVEHSGPCRHCRVRHVDHDDDEMGHEWRSVWTWNAQKTRQEDYTNMRMNTRVLRGDYAAPLPPPAERRRIRLAAGWTQEQVADELHISRQYVSSFEKSPGWRQGVRLRGREPTRELRAEYSELLRRLEMLGT
jgi:DNA-binding XRE family transcriptional regulator